jgi:hypothetical protein
MPDIMIRVQKPVRSQVPMNPTDVSAQVKSPSQGRVMASRPIARKIWLTVPSAEYIQIQATPAAAPGMICGRKSATRARAPVKEPLISRTIAAAINPKVTGIAVKKRIRYSACHREESNWGSRKTLT